jgi:lipoprotein-anchoring transpeptidase ErfK/SrfK
MVKNKFNKFWLTTSIFAFLSAGFVMSSVEAKKKSHHSPSAESIPATGAKVFVFDSPRLRWIVYGANGHAIRSGHAVGGKYYCPDVGRGCRTPSGTFRIFQKAGPNFHSSRYPLPNGGAPMPYAMFFHKNFAIHGANSVPNHQASHGCIRVYPSDAAWLSHNLPYGTKVIVRPY